MASATPALNHVALTVDQAILKGPKREALKDFLGSVFGWEEIPQLTNDGKRLVFRLYRRGQFLYLVSGKRPSELQGADHFGIEVSNRATLNRMVAAAKRFKKKDPGVQIIDTKVNTETPTLRLWNAYVRYLLPLMVEVQFYEEKMAAPAAKPKRRVVRKVASLKRAKRTSRARAA